MGPPNISVVNVQPSDRLSAGDESYLGTKVVMFMAPTISESLPTIMLLPMELMTPPDKSKPVSLPVTVDEAIRIRPPFADTPRPFLVAVQFEMSICPPPSSQTQ